MGGNDGKARVLLTQDVVRAAAEQPREQPRKAPIAELAIALRAHVETLKGDVARLEGELTHAQANADCATAELKTDIERLTAELAGERAARQADQEQLAVERAARQADQEQHQEQLAAERTARQTDQEHAAARQADQEQQIAAARAAADRATAELVELARRLAEIAEKQTSAETAAAEPEREGLKLNDEMMTLVPPKQIGGMFAGEEAMQLILQLAELRRNPDHSGGSTASA
jgi:chromosome segregation ATPase